MHTDAPTRGRTRDMAYIALFAVLIGVCSWISIPTTVPFTLQTFAVFLACGVLGGRRGALAVLVYLLLGLIGVPVYSAGRSGVGVLFGNTGGYLFGCLLAALVVWAMERLPGRRTWMLPLSMLLGQLACYALGTLWFMAVYARSTGAITLGAALSWCVVPFIVPDLIKIALALHVRRRLVRIMARP